MKRLLIPVLLAVGLAAHALPTYEPLAEFNSLVASNGSNMVCTLNGVALAQATSGTAGVNNVAKFDSYLAQSIDFSSGGLAAPGGEAWTTLNFAGTNKNLLAPNGSSGVGSATIKGLDVAIIQDTNNVVFPNSGVASVLPATFPGFPPSGTAITNMIENASQPAVFTGAGAAALSPYMCGNSALLNLSQVVTRPASGTKTIYVSYLLNVAQAGQLGSGNQGRYLAFVCQTNMTAGVNSATSYTYWKQMFDTYNTTTAAKIAYHGLLSKSSTSYYVGACDSSAGKEWATTPFFANYAAPVFVVGAYQMSASGADTNFLWANPATGSFGGATPPTTAGTIQAFPMTNAMPDIAGIAFISRVGNGASGGVGTNYIANLIVGTTWSYVTGGPEFTNQPIAGTNVNIGQTIALTGQAIAAGQSVSYRWQKISGGVTNNLTDGIGVAGGTATVSGSGTATLTIFGIGAGDVGTFQLVATASGTSYTLASSQAVVGLADPQIVSNPSATNLNYGATANFSAQISTANAPLLYQWFRNGSPLSNGSQPGGSSVSGAIGNTGAGTTFNFTLSISGATYQDAATYNLVVTNNISLKSTTASANLTINDPYIVTQPSPPVAPAGGNATFSVSVSGSPTLSYQWFENGSVLTDGSSTITGSALVSGSQTASLTLTGVQDADNGNYSCTISSGSSGQSTNTTTTTLVVQDPLTVTAAPRSWMERVGDHLAFVETVSGGGPIFQWRLNGTPISGATNSYLVLTNIQPSAGGTYSVVVQNATTLPITNSATLTVVNSAVLPLYATNILVARTGDGVQNLSGATGNTLYLDQYTPAGTYVSTVQIPDSATRTAYGVGSTASAGTSPALIVQGAGNDAANSTLLTLSGGNQQFINVAGYCVSYPFVGSDVTVGATSGAFWRGLATLNAFGIYSLAYTNTGLYSGGNHTIRSTVTLDGTNFWTTGQAGANGVKFVSTAVSSYATGNGVPTITSSGAGSEVVQIASGNLYFSDWNNGSGGIYICSGTPEPLPSNNSGSSLLINDGSFPIDFAISPDLNTIYIADGLGFGGTGSVSGGIQRWDTNTASGGYSFSYTLPAEPSQTLGACGLAVDFSAAGTWGPGVTGAKIFATTYGSTTNSFVSLVDNGSSSLPTVITTAGVKNALRGVRFGPAALVPTIVAGPLSQTNFPGNNVSFAVSVSGSAPFTYQWFGPSGLITGATNSSLTVNSIGFGNAGGYYVVVGNPTGTNATSPTALLTVTAGAPTISPAVLPNYTETVGDHVGWSPTINGTLPITFSWYFNGNPAPLLTGTITNLGAGFGGLSVANIQTTNAGTYKVIASNIYGSATNTSGGVLTVATTLQTLSSNNLIVARIGDGVQPLSSATGNTLYLDQVTTSGVYVNTIQIPDEGIGQAYGMGGGSSSSLAAGSQSILVSGGGADAAFEGVLTLSPNNQNLAFGGYVQAHPFSGADVTIGANGGANWRGIGTVDAYGYYTLNYTNTGLYSQGLHQIHSAVDVDGNGTNFFSTGQSGGGNGVKLCDVANEQASGIGIVSVGGSFSGTRVAQIVNGNLVFSDVGATPIGIYGFSGLPNALSTASLLIAETNSPMDFAVSPDGSTVYIADNGTFAGTNNPSGGIQRWDGTTPNSYIYSYTLPTGNATTAGARALTVDYSPHSTWGAGVTGAKLYVTTAESSGNRLIKISDNGPASSAITLASAALGQILAGVRFGPVVVAPSFALQPQSVSALAGGPATFTSAAGGSRPFTYQWYFQAGGVGSFISIAGATNATYHIGVAGGGNVGNYYVIATSLSLATVQSGTVSLSLATAPYFTSESYLGAGVGFQVFFTGTAGIPYTLHTTTNLSLGVAGWTTLTSGSLSGGIDNYIDSAGGTDSQRFYILSSP